MPQASKIPPVVREMVRKRVDELLRENEPFTSWEVATPRIVEFINGLDESQRYAGVSTPSQLVGHLMQSVFRSKKYRTKVYRRLNRATMKFEVRNRREVFYPSNDRERYNLSASEVFLRYDAPKTDAEPPVRSNGTQPTEEAEVPTPDAKPTDVRRDDAPSGQTFTVAGWCVAVTPPAGMDASWGVTEFEADVVVIDNSGASRIRLSKEVR